MRCPYTGAKLSTRNWIHQPWLSATEPSTSKPKRNNRSSPVWASSVASWSAAHLLPASAWAVHPGSKPLGRLRRSRAEQCQRDDGDVVASTVGMLAGVEDDGIDQVFSDPIAKPLEVLDVDVLDPVGQFDLDAQYPAIRVLDYQVHFVVVVASA